MIKVAAPASGLRDVAEIAVGHELLTDPQRYYDHLCAREYHAQRRAELVSDAGGQGSHRHQAIGVVELLEIGQSPLRIHDRLRALLGILHVEDLELACKVLELNTAGLGLIHRPDPRANVANRAARMFVCHRSSPATV